MYVRYDAIEEFKVDYMQ